MFVQVPGFEDYLINHEGQVVSTKFGKWRVMKARINSAGYRGVGLVGIDGVRYAPLHRLVLRAFRGHSELHVNHKNCDKLDNRLENLEYCTPSENTRHAVASGVFGDRKSLNEIQELQAKLMAVSNTQRAIAEWFKVDQATISRLLKG